MAGVPPANLLAAALAKPSKRGFASAVRQGHRKEASRREKNYDFVQHRPRNPFVKGKKPSLQPNNSQKKDTNYATQQSFFCGNRAVYDCLLHGGLGALRVGFHAHTGYHHCCI